MFELLGLWNAPTCRRRLPPSQITSHETEYESNIRSKMSTAWEQLHFVATTSLSHPVAHARSSPKLEHISKAHMPTQAQISRVRRLQ